MIKKLFQYIAGILLLLIISSCSQQNGGIDDEGVIEYSATVVDPKNPMLGFAPDKMVIRFKNNRSAAEMNAGMGLFSTSFISDPEQKTMTQIVKLLNKKVFLVQATDEIEKEIALHSFELTHLKETKKIAGYDCQKAHVKMHDDHHTEFDIFYTTDINIDNPNFSNPFYMIDGVLMEYQMEKFGLEMKFVAKKVKKELVDDAAFQIPSDYKAVSTAEMNSLFESFQ